MRFWKILPLLVMAMPAYAQIAVKNLPAGGTISSGNLLICDQSNVTSACTFAQLMNFVTSNFVSGNGVTVINNSGNPQFNLNQPSRTVTGTTDTIRSTDGAGIVLYAGSTTAVSIPSPTATGFGALFAFATTNNGTGTVTFTPTVAIDGNATIPEPPGTGCTFWEDATPIWHIDYSACSALLPSVPFAWSAAQSFGGGLTFPALAASGNPSVANTWMYATNPISGTASSSNTPPRWGAFMESPSSNTLVCSGSALCGLHYWRDPLESGWDGNQNMLNGYLEIDSPPVTPGSNAVGFNLLMNVNSSQGGVAGCWGCTQGALFVFNPSIFTNSGAATNIHLWTGAEWDTTLSAGGSTSEKHIMTMVTGPNDAVRGTLDDSTVGISTQDNTNTSSWKNLIECGNVAHNCPLATDSVIFNLPRRQIGGTNQTQFFGGFDLSWGQMTSGGFGFKNYGFETDSTGEVWANGVTVGAGGLTTQTAVVASISTVTYGGYNGGAYFDQSSFPILHLDAPAGGGTQATATVATMQMTAAILNFTSASGVVTATDVGCQTGDVLTVSGVTGTAPTVTLTVTSGHVSSVAQTTAGSITASSGTITTTGGHCTTQPTIAFGFGIATLTLTNAGTTYGCNPAPNVWTTGPFTNTTNTPAQFSVTMTCTTGPLVFSSGPQTMASWGTNGAIVGASGTQILTDSTASDSVATLAAWALPVYNFGCGSGTCTVTNLTELYLPAPLDSSGTWSGSGLYSLFAAGNVKIVGTLTSGSVLAKGPIETAGTAFTVASGTGACTTTGTVHGGVQAGDFTCTGTTGASTVTLTLSATATAYACWGRDVTTPTTVTQTGAKSTTSVTLTFTSVTTSDVVQYGCLGY